LPQFSPATAVLLAIALLGAAWLAGLLKLDYHEGQLSVRLLRSGRVGTTFELRDTWLSLGLAMAMGWAVAAAVEHSAWVPETEGRLVPAMAAATVVGWIAIVSRVTRLTYLVASLPALLVGLIAFTPSPLTSRGASLPALRKWALDLPSEPNLVLLMTMIAMFLAAGLWTSWWVFRRRNGLVALLPTGTIMAVEIINDTVNGAFVTFATVVWLSAAACLLLRLNFVALKEGWRSRRLMRSADSGWTFGEVGVEATVAILAVAFILAPPLSSSDISGALIPGAINGNDIHPFGLGTGSQPIGVGSVGYSETIQPGAQLNARSQTVMVISGGVPTYYPYWRGIAQAGWDGIQWYSIPSTVDVPVRQQPLLRAGATLPRDDLPSDAQRIEIQHTTIRVVANSDLLLKRAFSGGEIVSVNQPTYVQGIMTSVPAAEPGPSPAPVNVAGRTAPFDTVDIIGFARRLSAPYTYTVTEAIPKVDVADLQADSTNYPAWLAPYTTLYYGGRTHPGYSTFRDADILTLAQSIVQTDHATNPYDVAKALESWFRTPGRFKYTLKPGASPVGVRPLDNFLFNTKAGYCTDFSTAMNVMLRLLGIPSREMGGFSQGILDEKTGQLTVNAIDSHNWVEVFFPGYGWIPFEPTPDSVNSPINRPQTAAGLNGGSSPAVEPSANVRPNLREPGALLPGGTSSAPFDWRPVLYVAGGLLLLIIVVLLLLLRWLLAVKDVPRIWRRLLFLGDRLSITRHPGDTPAEFGGRLAASVATLDDDVRRLATLYTTANFRRGGLSADELVDARQAWSRIRRGYVGLMAKAWRDAWVAGRVVSEEEAGASRSREPSPRR
jgi:hypothetical protein